MDNEENEFGMNDLLTHSLEGNALAVQDAVNALLSQKALDALSAMKVDVAQSIYGTYGSAEQEAEIEQGTEEDGSDWEIPEDDAILDDDIEGLFDELEELTDDEETEEEQPYSEEDISDE